MSAHSSLVVPEQPAGGTIRVPVVKIFDGDGFLGRIKACEVTGNPFHQGELEFCARFGFIDAPELGQPGGNEAKAFLDSLIGGKAVDIAILTKMDTGGSLDRYGRVVCVPYLAEQCPAVASGTLFRWPPRGSIFGRPLTVFRNIELEMVINGWAWVLARYGPDTRYFDALAEAQRERRGIWALDNNIAPWEFKRRSYRAAQIIHADHTDDTKPPCPRQVCGGRLVRRNGKFGIFLGCSNFPKCRYSRAVEKG